MKSEKFTLTRRMSFGSIIKMSMLSVLLTAWYSSVEAQCPLACNNLVQVSMDENCVVQITPDMMLEGQGVSPGCNYVVQVLGTNGQALQLTGNNPETGLPWVGQNWVTSAQVGLTLTVKVWLGNNSCWGTIKIEDKLAPTIVCPAPVTIACWDPATFGKPDAYDNCNGNGTVKLPDSAVTTLSDVTTELPCTDMNRAVRRIRYQAKDASGNQSAVCERVIYYSKITLANVAFPKNYDGTVGNRPHLQCDGGWAWNAWKTNANVPFPTSNWDKNNNKYPDPEETGAPFVRDNSNITGFIRGYRVGTPITPGTPSGCTAGNLVGYDVAKGTWITSCDNNTGTSDFYIDTFYNPIIGSDNICKINTTFSDQRIDICTNSFKVLRNWTVLDWCSGGISTKYQIIKVVDDEGPTATIPADPDITVAPCAPDFTISSIISADPYTCTGSWIAHAPINIFDCSGAANVTYTVMFALADAAGNPPVNGPYYFQFGNTKSERITSGPNAGKWQLTGLPLGCSWLKYTLTDACGNSTDAFTEIRVVDKTPPVAVCDEFTVVTLSNNGWAHVFAESFDDGSHDNCTDVEFEVRRTTAGCGASTTAWGEYVQFCCEDVGKEIMVELRVTDDFGNSNTCMVIANVQDKVPPVITCPGNVIIACGADTSANVLGKPVYSETALSTPYFTDNCPNPKMSWKNFGTIDNCGQGVITRVFTVTDNGGRTASCTQIITIRNSSPYNGPTTWPTSPKEVTGCMNVDTDPSKTGTPTIGAGACSQVAYTYEDQVFPFVDGVCFKILRKWTVIDWCKFAPNTDNQGYPYPSVPTTGVNMWSFTQIIKVTENVKPVIANNSKADTDAFGENCNGYVDLKNSATDCTPAAQLRWTYTIDPNNDGLAPFITGTTNDASATYPVGTHKITWTVEDMCGNQATISYTFRVNDKKKPTPYCLSELTTVVMPTTGSIEIWAKDFDKGSTDNCPVTGCGLRFTFDGFKPPVSSTEVLFNSAGTVVGQWPTTNTALLAGYEAGTYQRWLPSTCSSAKMYTCDNLGPNSEDISVWDAAGNTDYCTVTLNVQANGTACSGARMAGDITTEENAKVKDVQVSLENMDSGETKADMTDTQGHFEFASMPEQVSYKITPEKDTDPLNGVSTLDLVMIQRHILGIQKLNAASKYVAADINKDNKVTASDLVELRKLILGIYAKLPNNKSWRFLDKSVVIADIANPWGVNEYIQINNFTTSMMANDFLAIKVGDINGSAAVNANDPAVDSRTSKVLNLVASEAAYTAGETVNVNIKADNFDRIAGAQMTFDFDASSLEFAGVRAGKLNVSSDNFNVLRSSEGKIAFSWNDVDGVSAATNETLFTLEFRAITNNTISNTINLTSDITRAEAYTTDLNEIRVAFGVRTSGAGEFALDQNNPNPFSTQTTISFTLPEAGTANLTIYDVTGKVIRKVSGKYPKGRNEVTFNAEEFNAQGVMFYELESNGHKATRKMILLNR